MTDYGDQWRERREARRQHKLGTKLHKCACGHALYDHESLCPICEAPNVLYGAKTPAAPSAAKTRE